MRESTNDSSHAWDSQLRSRVFRNVNYSFLSKIITFVFFYLQDILLARYLGIDGYAEWGYAYSVLSVTFWLSTFGINHATQSSLAMDGQNSLDQARHLGAGLCLRLFCSAFFAVLFASIAHPLAGWLGFPDKFPNLAKLLLVGSLLTLFYELTEFFKSALVGLKRFRQLCMLAVFEHGGYVLCCFLCFVLTKNVLGILLGYILAYMVSSIMGAWLTPLHKYQKTLKGIGIARSDIADVFRRSAPFIVACLTALVLLEMDTVMIGILCDSKEQLALYTVAKKVTSKATHVNEAVLTGIVVEFAALTKKTALVKKGSYRKVMLLNALLGLGLVGFICIVCPIIVRFAYGEAYAGSGRYLIALAPSYFLTVIAQSMFMLLYYQGMAGYVSKCYCVSIGVNLIMNLILIPRMGAWGAAIGTWTSLIPYVFLLARRTVRIFNGLDIPEE